jgi:predicted DNA-binding transcriptional regulator YafY
VGQRSSTETIVALVQAFLEQRTWSQADLAEHIGIGVAAVRKRLQELSAHGVPLTREEDPPQVYWSVPPGWLPGAIAFPAADALDLLRHLARLPRSAARERLLRRVLAAAPRRDPLLEGDALVTPRLTEAEEAYLAVAEDAAQRRVSLACTYFTVSRGALERRYLSVQRVVVGPPARLLAVCHRDGRLKWFRVDNVQAARLDAAEPYRPGDPAQIDAVLAQSVDGFHRDGAPVRCAFVVREPESRWVERNLLPGMVAEPLPGGLRVVATTGGVLRLARYVVGLGGVTCIDTPELRAAVRELARGALEAAAEPSGAAELSTTPPQG